MSNSMHIHAPPPPRLRVALRLAMLHDALPEDGSTARNALARATPQLRAAWEAAAALFRALADADPRLLPPLPNAAELARQAAAVPCATESDPRGPSLAPAWMTAGAVIQLLRATAEPRCVRAAEAMQPHLDKAMLNSHAALARLLQLPPGELQGDAGQLAAATLATLTGRCADPRASAAGLCELFAAVPGFPAPGLLAQASDLVRDAGVAPGVVWARLRELAAEAGDKPAGWVLQGAAAVLEGEPPATGWADL